MDKFERLGLIQLSVGGRKLSFNRVLCVLGAKKPNLTQDLILMLVECRRIGMPENTFFNLDKSYDNVYLIGRKTDYAVVDYDARVARALQRAKNIEAAMIGLSGQMSAIEHAFIFVAKYLCELRDQKYGTN